MVLFEHTVVFLQAIFKSVVGLGHEEFPSSDIAIDSNS